MGKIVSEKYECDCCHKEFSKEPPVVTEDVLYEGASTIRTNKGEVEIGGQCFCNLHCLQNWLEDHLG